MRQEQAKTSDRVHPGTAARQSDRSGKRKWFVQGSTLALATALTVLSPAKVSAQTVGPRIDPARSVQAVESVVVGNAEVTRGGTLDTVNFTTSENVINWSTLDSTTDFVNFLPAGTQVEYQGPVSGFTVLNRVFPTASTAGRYRGIALSGTVSGTLSSNGQIGNIWFYSPGGILATGTSAFNVGGLVLTTSDLAAIGGGGSQMDFLGVNDPASRVIVQPGATINATSGSNYIAMLAPSVVQGGTVTVNGSAAYVAAEQAQLTINNGLFDIAVTIGSEDAHGVAHTGTTTGPASEAIVDGSGNITDADAQAIYLVAIPKNTAMTMLVGGTLGYQPASSAAASVNGTIVLSAGANVEAAGTPGDPLIVVDKAGASATSANLALDAVTFTSNVAGYAADTVDARMDSNQTLTMGGDTRGAYNLDLEGRNRVDYGAAIGGLSTVEGDVSLRAGADQAAGGTIAVVVAGGASLPSGSSHVHVGGALTADASGRGRDDYDAKRDNGNTGLGQDAMGGTISFAVTDSGSFSVGSLLADASAQGGKGELRSGSATAGSIAFALTSGSVSTSGGADLNAGTASAEQDESGVVALVGSSGAGGDVSLTLSGGSLFAGDMSIDAAGRASPGTDGTVAQSNDGIGGHVAIDVSGGFHSLGSLTIGADAVGSDSFGSGGEERPGVAGRGSASLAITNPDSALTVGGDLVVSVRTLGIVSDPTADTISIQAAAPGPEAGLYVGGALRAIANAGHGSTSSATTAGSIVLSANDSQIHFGNLALEAHASPSGFAFDTEGAGLDYRGGTIRLEASGGGLLSGGGASIGAVGTGAGGAGSIGTGGSISVVADDGSIEFDGFTTISAGGLGGFGPRADDPTQFGLGSGGAVDVTVSGASGSLTLGDVYVEADGAALLGFDSSAVFEGDGANGVGGAVQVNVNGGFLDAGYVELSASGLGGLGGEESSQPSGSPAVAAGTGGSGIGGTAVFNLNGGEANLLDLSIVARGVGGEGGYGDVVLGTFGGDGGSAMGGTARLNAFAGTLSVTNALTITAGANTTDFGGNGGVGYGARGGAGGVGRGGTATFDLNGSANVSAGSVTVETSALGGRGGLSFATVDAADQPVPGGAGGAGSNARGGTSTFNNTAGSISFGVLSVHAVGTGGEGGSHFAFSSDSAVDAGGSGGVGQGGTAVINLDQDDVSEPAYVIDASGSGGAGGAGLDSGAGGAGLGGTARLNVNAANLNLGSLSIRAAGSGGTGGIVEGAGGEGGAGGGAVGGAAILDITGAAAVFTTTSPVILDADGTGAAGSAGGDAPVTGAAGRGGDAGSGAGGLVQVVAREGATLNLDIEGPLNARGIGGSGGAGGNSGTANAPGDGGAGGAATGGTVELRSTSGATLDVTASGGDIALNGHATGGLGGNGGIGGGTLVGNPGRNGGAQGGTVIVSADSSIAFAGSLVADVSAFGIPDDRANATSSDSFGGTIAITTGEGGSFGASGGLTANAQAAGGIGADGTGGDVTIDNAGSFSVPTLVVAASGTGGVGAGSPTGGAGGAGRGGSVLLTASSGFTGLSTVSLMAGGVGGAGGGSEDFGSVGGTGGAGEGGSITLELTGAGASFGAGATFSVDVHGFGGAGASGQGDPSDSGAFGGSGDGGAGGEGRGGAITLAARSGATFALPSSLTDVTANGLGGSGGEGGDNSPASAGDPGAGGSGGAGTGGALTLVAQGGTISAGAISLTANGIAGVGGGGGTDSGGGATTPGADGESTGGTIELLALEGSPGIISLGSTILEASALVGSLAQPGGSGGLITITDASTDPNGLITMDSLTAFALGQGGATDQGFVLSGGSGPIGVANDVIVDMTGTVELTFDGTGQLSAGGSVGLTAGGDITVTHSNNAGPTPSIVSGGALFARAGGNFEALSGSIIDSGSDISIRASGDVRADDLRAFDSISVSAGRNALINDVVLHGPVSVFSSSGGSFIANGITLKAGSNDDTFFEQFDPAYGVTITGDVTSTGYVEVRAGGSVVFAAGSSTRSDNGLIVETGDNIILEAGALIEAAANPATTPDADPFAGQNNLLLSAGSLSASDRLSAPPLTPIASIVAAGGIEANGFAAILSGNAIDGRAGTIDASSIRVNIDNAPANGVAQRDDDGLLSGGCLEGDVCLGRIAAANIVEIGQDSSNDIIDLIIEDGLIEAQRILITTRRHMVLGTGGIDSVLDAEDVFSLTSLEGDVDLRAIDSSAQQILISAAGSLIGTGVLSSANDIGISVGESIEAGGIMTGGELTSVANVGGAREGFFSVPGSLIVGSLSIGAGPATIGAGGDLLFGSIDAPGAEISLQAPGAARIDFTGSAERIGIVAGQIDLGNVTANSSIDLVSTGSITFGSLDGAELILSASEAITGTSATGRSPSGVISVEALGGNAAIDSVNSAGDASLAGHSITIGESSIGGNLALQATAGNVTVSGPTSVSGAMDIDASGDIVFESLTAEGGGFAAAAGGTLSANSVRATGDLAIDAAGGITLADASGSGIALRSANGTVLVTNDLDATSVTANVLVSGTAVQIDDMNAVRISAVEATNGGVRIGAAGGLAIGTVDATDDLYLESTDGAVQVARGQGRSITVRSAGPVDLSLSAPGTIDVASEGNITLADTSAGTGLIVSSGGAATLAGSVASDSDIEIFSNAGIDVVDGGSLLADGALRLDAAGLVTVDGVASGQAIELVASDLDLTPDSRLGDSRLTQAIDIVSHGSPLYLGGSGTPGGFSISNAEFSRIHSGGDIRVTALATGTSEPEIRIGDLDVAVGGTGGSATDGNIGPEGALLVEAETEARVEGNLTVRGAGPGTLLGISTLGRILLDTEGGNVRIEDGSGNLAGSLLLSAPFVAALSSTALQDIQDRAVREIDERLAVNDGVLRDEGFFQASNIAFEVRESLFIQNSGAGTEPDARRGFVAETMTINALDVVNPIAVDPNGVRIVINGVVGGATGIDAIAPTTVNANYNGASTINGCLIANPAGCATMPVLHAPPNYARDKIEEDDAPDGETIPEGRLTPPLFDFGDPAGFEESPLIDDPVTGAGNEDLWITDIVCDGGEGGAGCGTGGSGDEGT